MAPLSEEASLIIQHLLIEDEGLSEHAYLDCCGKPWRQCSCEKKGRLTIGVGRNLDDQGISENEAIGLLANDIKRLTALVERYYPWFPRLNVPRQVVIISMVFNMGVNGFDQFQKMITCIESGDFASAAREMLKSRWSLQVKERATRLAVMMKTGQF